LGPVLKGFGGFLAGVAAVLTALYGPAAFGKKSPAVEIDKIVRGQDTSKPHEDEVLRRRLEGVSSESKAEEAARRKAEADLKEANARIQQLEAALQASRREEKPSPPPAAHSDRPPD